MQAHHYVAGFWLNRMAEPQPENYQNLDSNAGSNYSRCLQTLEPMRQVLALVLLALTLWGVAFSLAKSEAEPPHGQLFVLAVLCISAYFGGWVVSSLRLGLPQLLGMLLMGIFLRNIGFAEFKGPYVSLESILRNTALVIILTRAGFGLNPTTLRNLSFVIARLAVLPSLVEIVVSGVMSHFLFGLSWIWAFLLGSVMAAVSPAVVIPCLLSLKSEGYGLTGDKDIPTLIMAAATLDDIIGISVFTIILSAIFSTGNMVDKILEGPLGVIFGTSFGIAWGLVVGCIPSKDDAYISSLRTLLTAAGGLLAMFGSKAIGYEGAGPLGCVVAAFVARQLWRKQGWTEDDHPVAINFKLFWKIFEPILFGLIGTAVDLKVLDVHKVALGIACLSAAISLRLVVSVLIASGANLSWKEKLFVAMSWLPKATVQAAIGPTALSYAKSEEDIKSAGIILVVAVLSILMTAPAGAILVSLGGRRLLQKVEEQQPLDDPERQSIFVHDGQQQAASSSYQQMEASCSSQCYSTFEQD